MNNSKFLTRAGKIVGEIADIIADDPWPELEEQLQAALEARAEQDEEREPHPEIRKRRDKVKELWQGGLSDQEMAMALAVSESTIKRDRKAMGLKSKKT